MNSRKIGINAELKILNILKKNGFKNATTTRETNKYLDSQKIDIDNIPLYIQIKAGKQHIFPIPILKEIEKNIKKNNLEDHPILIIRVYNPLKGNKESATDILVFMLYNNFVKYFNYKKLYKIKVVATKINPNFRFLLKNLDYVIRNSKDKLIIFTFETFLKLIKDEKF